MQAVNDCKNRSVNEKDVRVRVPTLSVRGMPGVDIKGLLTLSDCSSQGEVRLHHPLLVVTIDNSLRGHGQRVTLGHVLGQGG